MVEGCPRLAPLLHGGHVVDDPRAPRNSLVEMLEVEDRGEGVYGARLESFWGVASPGDAFARAALAASEGVSAPLSSLQATMLGVARPDQFLSLEPEELGPELRRVRVRDSAALVCDVMLRFSHERDGLTYQSAGADLEVPAPEDLPSEAQVAAAEGWSQYAVGPIESRRIGEHRYVEEHEPAEWLGWLQPRESVDEAALRTPALVFLSEYRSHWGIELRLGRDFPKYQLDLLDGAQRSLPAGRRDRLESARAPPCADVHGCYESEPPPGGSSVS